MPVRQNLRFGAQALRSPCIKKGIAKGASWQNHAYVHELDRERLIPTFQPIVSVSTGGLCGYELLGRYKEKDGTLKSLGAFFHDPKISEEEKLSVDRILRRKALFLFKDTKDLNLFINMRPYWIASKRANKSLLLEVLQEYQIPGSRIVIEITESDINDRLEGLLPRIEEYRAYGCRIAIDDFHFKDFDRLILFKPDIVKIHIDLVRKGAKSSDYRKLLNHISGFAEQLGATTLFEGIEKTSELELAISTGGSLLQGFLFSPAQERCMEGEHFPAMVQAGIKNSIQSSLSDEGYLQKIFDAMNAWSHGFRDQHVESEESSEEFLQNILSQSVPDFCFRCYLCDAFGRQVSENFERSPDGSFIEKSGYKHKNWAWRPYYFKNLQKMRRYRNGSLSEPYLDLHTKEKILTYSCPVGDHFLFCDLKAPATFFEKKEVAPLSGKC